MVIFTLMVEAGHETCERLLVGLSYLIKTGKFFYPSCHVKKNN